MIHYNGDHYPDVFLAGAPKSGTTFLFNWLAKHPKVCASDPKETDYYLDEENPNKKSDRWLSQNAYPDHYNSLDGDLLHLDGSVWTIYQKELMNRLATLKTKPKALFILREPARRILSSFQYTSNNMAAVKNLTFHEYTEALLKADFAAIQRACKSNKSAYSLQNELLFSDYSFYLNLWKEAIGEDNMQILLFEELKTDQNLCYVKACEFLGLKVERLDIDAHERNKSVIIKNKSVHYFLHRIFALVGYKVPFKDQLKRLYSRLQHVGEKKPINHEKDLAKLREYYKPLNQKLSKDFGLDLSVWN